MLKVGVMGVGMVGTPLARYLQEIRGYRRGESLFLYDIDPRKGYGDDINRAEVIFICVPTPRAANGSANISAIESALRRIHGEKIVVIKSTIPPGTSERLQKEYPSHKILFNPEFLTERQAWEDFIRPDCQIVGFTEKSLDAAHAVLSLLPKAPFMSPWGVGTYQSVKISATEAEIIKYGRNVFFARKVNFANVLALLAEKLEADYTHIRKGLAADHRIGDSHLDVYHGGYKGFGGYCLPKDLSAFAVELRGRGLEACASYIEEDHKFNETVLAEQGLTLGDISVHDHEWIQKKLQNAKFQMTRLVSDESERANAKSMQNEQMIKPSDI